MLSARARARSASSLKAGVTAGAVLRPRRAVASKEQQRWRSYATHGRSCSCGCRVLSVSISNSLAFKENKTVVGVGRRGAFLRWNSSSPKETEEEGKAEGEAEVVVDGETESGEDAKQVEIVEDEDELRDPEFLLLTSEQVCCVWVCMELCVCVGGCVGVWVRVCLCARICESLCIARESKVC